MTVGQIAAKIAWFFNEDRTDFLDALNGDMIISAINDSRKDAERIHDWVKQQGIASLSVDPANGASLASAVLFDNETVTTTRVRVKTVNGAFIQDPNTADAYYPILMAPKGALTQKAREYLYRYGNGPSPLGNFPLERYPGDVRNYSVARGFKAYWQGDKIFLDPRPQIATPILLDANFWITDYLPNTNATTVTSATTSPSVTATGQFLKVGSYFLGQLVTAVAGTAITLAGNANANNTAAPSVPYSNMPKMYDDDGNLVNVTNNEDYRDWFTEHGGDYLVFGAICQSNFMKMKFVPREEGYLPAPEKYRDNAFAALKEWDVFMMSTAFTPMFLES